MSAEATRSHAAPYLRGRQTDTALEAGSVVEPTASIPLQGGLPHQAMSEANLALPRAGGIAYLARHGQTQSNVLRRYAGHSAEPLTELGRSEMSQLAARAGLLGITQIWTSEVHRARESAGLVGAVLDLPVRADARLNEMRMGPWEGLTEQEVADRYPDAHALWCTLPDRLALDGRETLAALSTRVTAVLDEAARQAGPLLLITHVAPIRVAILSALGFPLRLYKRVPVANGDCFGVHRERQEVYPLGEERSLRERLSRSLAGPESSVA